jgi:hypothetical protein
MVNRLRWNSRYKIVVDLRQGWIKFHHTLRRWLLLLTGKRPVWTTQNGVEIAVAKGTKPQSPYDFVVKYREPGKKQWRTPKHVHLIVELYVKEAYDKALTHQLCNHLLNVFKQVQPITVYPPSLQYFQPAHATQFQALNAVGEMTVEFLLVVSELIFIQEKTNYKTGSLTYDLYKAFGVKDRFCVIHMATYRGR